MQTKAIATVYTAVSTFLLLPVAIWACWAIWHHLQVASRAKPPAAAPVHEKPARPSASCRSQLDHDKALYHQLHTLEDNPKCLPIAYSRLVSLFSETLTEAISSKDETILSALPRYNRQQLEAFMKKQHDGTSQRYEDYLGRRRSGGQPEMFPDRETAIYWLRNSLCVKYVDGSWTGHMHKSTTSTVDRRATAVAWQVMSEELGDGSLAKNHVYLMEQLMREIGEEMPKPWDAAFIDPALNLQEARCWKAAIAQLTVSIFPDRLMPEAIGFNLAYEQLAYHLLVTIYELKKLKIDPYYFVLHVAIDNGSSGHSAMGLEAAIRYVESQPKDQREAIWTRIKAGYVLAEGLPTTPDLTNVPLDRRMSALMHDKSMHSHQLHASSRVKIGGCQRLDEWLHPANFTQGKTNYTFLRQLGSATPWVVKGHPEKSLLVKEISWGGKMFGAFTNNERKLIEEWITKLGSHQIKPIASSVYYNYVGKPIAHRFPPSTRAATTLADIAQCTSAAREPLSKPDMERFVSYCFTSSVSASTTPPTRLQRQRLLALYFVSLSILENMITLPARCSNPVGMHVVQALRALHGFEEGPEGADEGVSGMDQVNSSEASFYDLGLAICEAQDIPPIQSLADISSWPLQQEDRDFCAALLRLSSHYVRHQALLLGLALGCSESVHTQGMCYRLSQAQQGIMAALAIREQRALRLAIAALPAECQMEAHKGQQIFLGRVASIRA